MQTLHRSKLRQVVNDAPQIATLFAGGRMALVSGSVLDPAPVYLVDLVGGKVQPSREKVRVFRFLPAGEQVVIDGGASTDPRFHLVDRTGALRTLETVDLSLLMIGNYEAIADEQAHMEGLLEQGALEGLTEVQSRKWEQGGEARTFIDGFFNERYFISINAANERDLPTLRAHSRATIVNDYTTFPDPQRPGYRIEVERAPFAEFAGGTTNQNIERVQVFRGSELVKEVTFQDLIYHATIVGDRLYFVGASVQFLELD